MPANVGYRRWDLLEPEALIPANMYVAPAKRWAILAIGVVVAIVLLPPGVRPTLLSGQTAVLSTTLRVGDRP